MLGAQEAPPGRGYVCFVLVHVSGIFTIGADRAHAIESLCMRGGPMLPAPFKNSPLAPGSLNCFLAAP